MPTATDYEAKIRALGWTELQALWEAIKRGDTPGWEPGKAFEYLILRMFELDGARVRWPYTVELLGEDVEEIDGAVHWQHLACLVESKDWKDPLPIGPIAKLRNQLLRRPAGTIGVLFSRSGFTLPARLLTQFALPQAILFWHGEEVEYAISKNRAGEYLVRKYQACVEEAIPDYSIRLGED